MPVTEQELKEELQELKLCLLATEANLDFLNTMHEINTDTIAHLRRENKKIRAVNAELMGSIAV